MNSLFALVIAGGLAFADSIVPAVEGVASVGSKVPAELLDSRTDATSAQNAVERLKEGAPLARLQARFFWAENYLKGNEQLAAFRDNIADGTRALGRDSFDDVDAQASTLTKASVPLLFWTTISYARTIPSISLFKRLAAAKRFHRMLDKMVELDGNYYYGGPHRTLSSFLARAPRLFGGDPPGAQEHARKAAELGPTFAGNYTNLTEVLILVKGASKSKSEWEPMLRRCAELPAPSGFAAEHRAAQKRAQALLAGAKVD